MKVYMMTDLEGVSGVVDFENRADDSRENHRRRAIMRRLLTGEVNAAIEGLFAAGVEEVLVNDAHGAGRTILYEELSPGVRIARGVERPQWLVGIAPRFDALVQVAMHSMSDTPDGCLAHTMSTEIKAYRVNGRDVGEMELAAYLAGELGIPWIFTSGDLHACREAERFLPGMVTAPVKEGLGRHCAIHLAPTDARALIRDRVGAAVRQAGDIEPLVAKPPVMLEIESRKPGLGRVGPGGEWVSPCTVRYSGESLWQVFHRATYGRDVPLPR